MSRGGVLLRAGVAAFLAIMLAGPGAAVFPSTLSWAAWIACPAGTTPTPRTFHASYHRPGQTTSETSVAFYCVAPDGTEHERTLAAMGGLWLMYFMGITVVLSLLAMRSGGWRAGHTAGGVAPSTRPVPADVEAKARELLARDQKIHAIRIVREASGMGLREAKDWVEALPLRAPRTVPATLSAAATEAHAAAVPPGVVAEARDLMASGNPISAIKVVRDATGMGLAEAKAWIEALPLHAPTDQAPDTPAERLAELKRMLDGGLITPAEYDAKKAEILAEL